jgi:hypothetical protein
MPAARDDYILRLIQQAAAALRRFRERLGSGDSAEAVSTDVSTAIATLLGPQRAMLERLDGWSAANLLGDPERVFLWAEMVRLQSDLERAAGRDAAADQLATRAAALAKHGTPLRRTNDE